MEIIGILILLVLIAGIVMIQKTISLQQALQGMEFIHTLTIVKTTSYTNIIVQQVKM